jgi:ABC-type sugar transport system ATPase subunit
MSVIKNLTFEIEKFKLNVPHLEISDNGLTAITGPSGSGKSTFLKILIGIHQPRGWHWNFKNVDLAALDISKRNLGVVFQNYQLFPHMTAEMNIKIVMKSKNNLNAEALEKLEYYKNKLNLTKCWQTQAQNLSGGEQQRIAILRAVMSRSEIILLDEPFSALDESNKHEAYKIVKELLYEAQIPALMVTHSLAEAHYFTEQFIKFDNGHLV